MPYILFGAIAGPVADRWNRRRLIIGGHLIEGVLGGHDSDRRDARRADRCAGVLVALLSATAFVFSDAAVFGAVPALVGTERLAAANGFLARSCRRAEIIGPAIGGLLAAGRADQRGVVRLRDFLRRGRGAVDRSARRSGSRLHPPDGCDPRSHRSRVSLRPRQSHRRRRCSSRGSATRSGSAPCWVCSCRSRSRSSACREGSSHRLALRRAGVGALIAGLMFARVFIDVACEVDHAVVDRLRIADGSVRWRSPPAGWSSLFVLILFEWSIATTITTGITYRQLAAPDDLRSSVNVFGRMISWGGQPFGAATGALIASAAQRASRLPLRGAVDVDQRRRRVRVPASLDDDPPCGRRRCAAGDHVRSAAPSARI